MISQSEIAYFVYFIKIVNRSESTCKQSNLSCSEMKIKIELQIKYKIRMKNLIIWNMYQLNTEGLLRLRRLNVISGKQERQELLKYFVNALRSGSIEISDE